MNLLLLVLILFLLFVASVHALSIYSCPGGVCISWQS